MKTVARKDNGKFGYEVGETTSFLNMLSRKRIYAKLDFIQSNISDGVNLEADYFDHTIQIIIAHHTQYKVEGQHQLVIRQDNGKVVLYEVFEQRNVKKLVAAIVKALNCYVKTRAFTIIKYNRGQYQLLDPNGMDYIGQYVTLKDAKNVCYKNFTM